MIVGDDCGNIALYDVQTKGMDGGGSLSASSYRLTRDKRHTDWVTKVRKYQDLNFMISSSLDGTLKLGELERGRKATRVFGETDKHAAKKGVYNFTWSSTVKVLASCGLERTVSLWSPYTHKPKPIAVPLLSSAPASYSASPPAAQYSVCLLPAAPPSSPAPFAPPWRMARHHARALLVAPSATPAFAPWQYSRLCA